MDNQSMLNMLSGMIGKLSDEDLARMLEQAKTLLSPQDYEKLKTLATKG